MQKREKIMAMALGGVVLFWFGMPIFRSNFVDPIKELENLELSKMEDANLKMAQQVELAKQGKQLEDWKKISLPPKPTDAHRVYQNWLTDIALMSGFANPRFTLENRAENETFVRIPVKIEAQATLQELAQFLERFNSVNLLQRISRLDLDSPAAEGNPELKVTLVAEGLSLKSAPDRNELFPRLTLEKPLDKEATHLVVDQDLEGFPQSAPFRVRIGDEFCNVTQMTDGVWTLQRGVAQTFSNEHPAGESVELFPMVPQQEFDQRQVQNIWSQSLFTKPAPLVKYEPRLASSRTPPAIRGKRFEYKLNVTGWNPAFGQPRFTLINGPEGLDIDERTGSMTWPVSTSVETGEILVETAIWGSASKDAGFTDTVTLRVRDPNAPPVLEGPTELKFYLGRETVVPLAARDPDAPNGSLRFTIADAPEGMSIDERRGVIRWRPPESMDAQQSSVRVTMTDSDPDEDLRASTTVTLPVSVEEDSARFAYLTASFTRRIGDDKIVKEAWIFDRATNKRTTLHEGEQFTISDFVMTVQEIGPDYIKVQRDNGLYQLNFEQPLVQMTQLAVNPPPQSPPGEANQEKSENSATDTPAESTSSNNPPVDNGSEPKPESATEAPAGPTEEPPAESSPSPSSTDTY